MLRNLFLPFRRGDILSFRAKAGMDSRGMARMTDNGGHLIVVIVAAAITIAFVATRT